MSDAIKGPEIKSGESLKVLSQAGEMSMHLANREELIEIEHMIRDAAEKGEGFGMDEFNPSGLQCRRFLKTSKAYVVKNQAGVTLGGGIYGESAFSRNKGLLATSYIVVKEEHRKCNIATEVLNHFMDMARADGYGHYLQDVLITKRSFAMIILLQKLGFSISGSFPMCAFVKDVGFVNSDCFSNHCLSNQDFNST